MTEVVQANEMVPRQRPAEFELLYIPLRPHEPPGYQLSLARGQVPSQSGQ